MHQVLFFGLVMFGDNVQTVKTSHSTTDFLFWFHYVSGFDTRSGNILSFLLPLFQEGQLSVTGESMCTKYWLTA